MSLKTVTIPPAGQQSEVSLTGNSIVIYKAAIYNSVDQTPLVSFNDAGDQRPILPGATYQAGNGFSRILITGTDESEGDQVTLYATSACLQDHIPIEVGRVNNVIPGETFSLDATNTPAQIPIAFISEYGLAAAIYISARVNDVAFTFLSDPDQGDNLGHVLPAGGEPIKIEGQNFITGLRFQAETAAADGQIIITPEY